MHLDALQNRGRLGRYFHNVSWLVGGRILRLVLSLTVSTWVARYLGPAEFGELSYQLSLVVMLSALATAGLDGLLVRELVNKRMAPMTVLGTAFGLRAGGGLVIYAGLLLFAGATQGWGTGLLMVAMLGADIVLQGFNVIDLYFQARVANKWVVVAGSVALVAGSVMRVVLIVTGMPLIYFAAVMMMEGMLIAGLLVVFYRSQSEEQGRWRFDLQLAKTLLTESWPLIVSAVVIVGYMRIDQLMLKSYAGEAAVGVYAAAVRLGEAWYFLPMFVGATLNPWILEGRGIGEAEYRRRLVRLYSIMTWMSLVVAGVLCVASPVLVGIFYGEQYHEAAGILSIHVWAGVAMAVGVAAGKWYVAEGYTIGAMRKALAGLGANVTLNFVLIPQYGAYGAAVSAVAGHVVANFFYDFFDRKVRPQLLLKFRALSVGNLWVR